MPRTSGAPPDQRAPDRAGLASLTSPAPRQVLIVVPARDEAERLARCLNAIDSAIAQLPPQIRTQVVVVADSCVDRTALIASRAGARTETIQAANVGRARAHGIDVGLGSVGVAHTWIANTDADSLVPTTWLVEQLQLAEQGFAATVGTVSLDPRSASAPTIARWDELYARGGALRGPGRHGHIHGANLGVSAQAYRQAGGFAPVAEHEDVLLVQALMRHASPIAWPVSAVCTSGRTVGRTPGGVSRSLRSLDPATLEPA